jgi:hypothetical protein
LSCRKRRSNRSVNPEELNQYVVLYRAKDPGEAEISGTYWSVTLAIVLEMVRSGEAQRIEVVSADNGTYTAYLETEQGRVCRERRRLGTSLRDVSCKMGPRVMQMAAEGVTRFRILVDAWSGLRHTPAVRHRCREQRLAVQA